MIDCAGDNDIVQRERTAVGRKLAIIIRPSIVGGHTELDLDRFGNARQFYSLSQNTAFCSAHRTGLGGNLNAVAISARVHIHKRKIVRILSAVPILESELGTTARVVERMLDAHIPRIPVALASCRTKRRS